MNADQPLPPQSDGRSQGKLPAFANENTGHQVKFEFQIYNRALFSISMSCILHGIYLTKILFSSVPKKLFFFFLLVCIPYNIWDILILKIVSF